ncbi:MAG: hypothetical protein CMJ28_07825 [Phycisphaerae bacterium]|nr:hypothetical protein [Phycisphaerae bacterium]
MTDASATYRDRIPGHVADEMMVKLSIAAHLSQFPAVDHPEVTAREGVAGAIVFEGSAGAVRRAAAAVRKSNTPTLSSQNALHPAGPADPDRNTFPYSFQSMIVAFVIAMAARSFVAEGFVIPTGSMAPTLRGQHVLMRGPQTGDEFAVGLQPGAPAALTSAIVNNAADRLLGPRFPGTGKSEGRSLNPRQGDRILTHKTLYHFREPRRWEVVVFRNPADPFGRAPTYIKRLCGLPNERLWIVDGDLFTAPNDSAGNLNWDAFQIQRKPEWVQRALWVPVYDQRHDQGGMSTPDGFGAFVHNGDDWTLDGPVWEFSGEDFTQLEWNRRAREFNNWNPYNVNYGNTPDGRGRLLKGYTHPAPDRTADIAFEVVWTPVNSTGSIRWVLEANQHRFEVERIDDVMRVRMRDEVWAEVGPEAGWSEWVTAEVDQVSSGTPNRITIWHVDQCVSVWHQGEQVLEFPYDWSARERLGYSRKRLVTNEELDGLSQGAIPGAGDPVEAPIAKSAFLKLEFTGGPCTLEDVQVARDLYHRASRNNDRTDSNPARSDVLDRCSPTGWGFGTHPSNLAELGPDQFLMLGDNSAASHDGRFLGTPSPFVSTMVDDAPYLVHRDLLVGRAWCVYFPWLLPLGGSGPTLVPNIGELRLIR